VVERADASVISRTTSSAAMPSSPSQARDMSAWRWLVMGRLFQNGPWFDTFWRCRGKPNYDQR
jgi:hypothetical protein